MQDRYFTGTVGIAIAVLVTFLSYLLCIYHIALAQMDTQHPLAQGLYAWYPVSQSMGVKWYDRGPYGIHASNVGAPVWGRDGTGRFLGLLQLNGSNYSEIPHQAGVNLSTGDPFSFVVWFNTTAYGDLYVKAQNVSPWTGYWFQVNSSGSLILYLADNVGTDSGIVTNSTGWNNGRLHMAVATYDGSGTQAGMQLYGDGVLQAVSQYGAFTTITGQILNSHPVRIGANVSLDNNYTGLIGEVTVYGRVLKSSEVQGLYRRENEPEYPDFLGVVSLTPTVRKGRGIME